MSKEIDLIERQAEFIKVMQAKIDSLSESYLKQLKRNNELLSEINDLNEEVLKWMKKALKRPEQNG